MDIQQEKIKLSFYDTHTKENYIVEIPLDIIIKIKTSAEPQFIQINNTFFVGVSWTYRKNKTSFNNYFVFRLYKKHITDSKYYVVTNSLCFYKNFTTGFIEYLGLYNIVILMDNIEKLEPLLCLEKLMQ